MSKECWGVKHALFKRFAVNEVVRNEDGVLIAKLLKVEKGGRSMQIAVLDLIDESCFYLLLYNGRADQTIEDVSVDSDIDDEGKRVLKIEGPYPNELQCTVNNLCFHIYIDLGIIKRETDWEKLRSYCEFSIETEASKKGLLPKKEDVEELYQSRRKKNEDEQKRYFAYVERVSAGKKGLKMKKGSTAESGPNK